MSWLGRLMSRNRADSRPRPLASGTRRADASLNGRWTNTSTGQGTTLDRHSGTGFVAPACLTMHEIDALMEFQAVARRIVRRESDDAMREGFDLTGFGEQTKAAIHKEADRLGIPAAIKNARAWGRGYGGGAIVMMIDDGRPPWEPVDWTALRKLRAVKAVDRYQLQVTHYDNNPHSPDFGKPAMYQLSLSGTQKGSGRIHASRVVPFIGVELPERVMIQRGGWGGSYLDLAWGEIRNWCSSNENAAEAITMLSQGVFKSSYLSDAMNAGEMQKAVERMEALHIGLGLLGDIVVDKEKEDYQIHQRTLAGLKDALEALKIALVAATDMPVEILMGQTQGGLNTGENAGPIRAWYDHVAALQPEIYTPALTKILRVMIHAPEGPTQGQTVEGWEVEWPSLWQLTDAEKATIRLQHAQARANDSNLGTITEDEMRQDADFAEWYGIDPGAAAPGKPEQAAQGLPSPAGDTGTIQEADASEFPAGEALVSLREAGRRLGVGPGSIKSMGVRGEIPVARVGGRYRVAMSQVIKAAAAAGAIAAPADGDGAKVLPIH